MTVGQLLHDLDHYGGGTEELVEWMGYSHIEHFGPQMQSWHAAVIASTTANCAPRKRGSRAFKAEDFMPGGKKSRGLSSELQRQLDERNERRKGKS